MKEIIRWMPKDLRLMRSIGVLMVNELADIILVRHIRLLQKIKQLSNRAKFARQYQITGAMGGPITGQELTPGYRASKWGPTTEQRIRWEAYKQGQRVDFDTGEYGTLSKEQQRYFDNRGQNLGSLSASYWSSIHGEGRNRNQQRMFMPMSSPS